VYRIFNKLVGVISAGQHGIWIRRSNFFFHKKFKEMPEQLEKKLEIETNLGIKDSNMIPRYAIKSTSRRG